MNTFLKIAGGMGLAAAAYSFFGRKARRPATLAGKLGLAGGGALGQGKGFFKGVKSALRACG